MKMTNKERHEMMVKYIELMRYTAQQLDNMWSEADPDTHDAMANMYPFHDSFDEIAKGIESWHEAQKVELLAKDDEPGEK